MKHTTVDPTKVSVVKKRNVYSHRIADFEKGKRREDAEARTKAFAGLTTEEKLEKLALRRGDSRKQVLKLTGRDMSAKEALALIRAEV